MFLDYHHYDQRHVLHPAMASPTCSILVVHMVGSNMTCKAKLLTENVIYMMQSTASHVHCVVVGGLRLLWLYSKSNNQQKIYNFFSIFSDRLEEWVHVISVPNTRASFLDIMFVKYFSRPHLRTSRIDLHKEIRDDKYICDFTQNIPLHHFDTSLNKTVGQNWCFFTSFTRTRTQHELIRHICFKMHVPVLVVSSVISKNNRWG